MQHLEIGIWETYIIALAPLLPPVYIHYQSEWAYNKHKMFVQVYEQIHSYRYEWSSHHEKPEVIRLHDVMVIQGLSDRRGTLILRYLVPTATKMSSQVAAILDLQVFRFYSNLNCITRKQKRLAFEISKIVRIHCKVVKFSQIFAKSWNFTVKHTNNAVYAIMLSVVTSRM